MKPSFILPSGLTPVYSFEVWCELAALSSRDLLNCASAEIDSCSFPLLSTATKGATNTYTLSASLGMLRNLAHSKPFPAPGEIPGAPARCALRRCFRP